MQPSQEFADNIPICCSADWVSLVVGTDGRDLSGVPSHVSIRQSLDSKRHTIWIFSGIFWLSYNQSDAKKVANTTCTLL